MGSRPHVYIVGDHTLTQAMSSQSPAVDGQESEVEQIQVLEFGVGGETYCVEIDHISEIVNRDELTEVPRSPAHVQGVMDLRGRTTSIIDPRVLLSIRGDSAESERIIIFDSELGDGDQPIGWLVDEVSEVNRFDAGTIESAPSEDSTMVKGIVRTEDELKVWVAPEMGSRRR